MARQDRQALSPDGTAPTGAPSAVVAYGSTFGTTEEIAERVADAIAARLGTRPALCDVAWTDAAEVARHEVLILGASTWDEGELQADWAAIVDELAAHDLRGRRVAVFGCGDGVGYPDTFGDALGILRDRLCEAGAETLGEVALRDLGLDPAAFSARRARVGDRLVGLLLDDAWDDARRHAAVEAWCDRLAHELTAPARAAPTGGDGAAGDAEAEALRRRLVRRTLATVLDAHPGALHVLREHGVDLAAATRHELATRVPLRVLLGGLCRVDDPAATLDDLVEHVREDLRTAGAERWAATEGAVP